MLVQGPPNPHLAGLGGILLKELPDSLPPLGQEGVKPVVIGGHQPSRIRIECDEPSVSADAREPAIAIRRIKTGTVEGGHGGRGSDLHDKHLSVTDCPSMKGQELSIAAHRRTIGIIHISHPEEVRGCRTINTIPTHNEDVTDTITIAANQIGRYR